MMTLTPDDARWLKEELARIGETVTYKNNQWTIAGVAIKGTYPGITYLLTRAVGMIHENITITSYELWKDNQDDRE